MGSLLGDWPSFDPHNFSQLRAAGSAQPITKLAPDTYLPTHNKTLPPPNHVIANESKNILIAKLYQKSAEKLRPKTKRTASDNLTPEPNNKQPRGSTANAES